MRTWAFLLGGLLIWAVHFFSLYIVASIWLSSPLARGLTLLVTLACLGGILYLVVRGRRHDGGTAMDRWVRSVATVRDTLSANIGHAGAAHPLVMLADALEAAAPGDRILLLGFGQGADVLLFEATDAIAGHRRPVGVSGWAARGQAEANYMKYLAFNGHLQMETGMRAEFDQKQPMTALYRNRRTVFGLVGGRCTRTGTIQFPRSEISVSVNDAAVGTQEDYPLADIPARIMTYTADSLGYTPDPPGCYGMVEFEGGGRMACEFTDVEPEAIEVGMEMRMMFRIKAVDERRQFTRYFWKAVPAAKES
ncbi:OB-fold domain-containing protein [Sphingomonas sp. SRS2]|uniref:OB-fold domain-containing protein n=1 Tax=Sphingomonas sp. SRS2 TaxID=133190 RepID=UPI000A00D53E|nr:OB-fold domain-containing protein [Sphingomonas sp. SRS2]